MAELQDIDGTVGELEFVEERVEQQASEGTKYEIPDKYRGKSVEDVVKMHQEAEKLMSRQAQEVGEVRKLADELIKSQLQRKPEPEEAKPVDLFENPDEYIQQKLHNDPELIELKQQAQIARQEQAKANLASKHPDAQSVIQDPQFAEWIKASKVRTQLFQRADAYDLDAADELLSTFKELRQVKVQRDDTVNTENRKRALNAAAVDTGGSGESSRKVFRRADLIRLKMNNPAKYEAMSDEIMAAYAEHRVR